MLLFSAILAVLVYLLIAPWARRSTHTFGLPTSRTLAWGVSVPTGFYDLGPVEAYSAATGHPVTIVMNYDGWSDPPNLSYASSFPTTSLRRLIARGYLPEISWDPWDPNLGVTQPSYSLAKIVSGTYDSYITRWAQAAKSLGTPILLRFASEMNGDWNSWSSGVNGNTPTLYVDAWRHVHDIFSSVGASNVAWIWSPNILGVNSDVPLQPLFPGDAYVNFVGIDGYSYPEDGCPSASSLLGPTLADIRSFTRLPAVIGETGVATGCKSRAQLTKGIYVWALQNKLRAVVWFDHPGSPDYVISPNSGLGGALASLPDS